MDPFADPVAARALAVNRASVLPPKKGMKRASRSATASREVQAQVVVAQAPGRSPGNSSSAWEW